MLFFHRQSSREILTCYVVHNASHKTSETEWKMNLLLLLFPCSEASGFLLQGRIFTVSVLWVVGWMERSVFWFIPKSCAGEGALTCRLVSLESSIWATGFSRESLKIMGRKEKGGWGGREICPPLFLLSMYVCMYVSLSLVLNPHPFTSNLLSSLLPPKTLVRTYNFRTLELKKNETKAH